MKQTNENIFIFAQNLCILIFTFTVVGFPFLLCF